MVVIKPRNILFLCSCYVLRLISLYLQLPCQVTMLPPLQPLHVGAGLHGKMLQFTLQFTPLDLTHFSHLHVLLPTDASWLLEHKVGTHRTHRLKLPQLPHWNNYTVRPATKAQVPCINVQFVGNEWGFCRTQINNSTTNTLYFPGRGRIMDAHNLALTSPRRRKFYCK